MVGPALLLLHLFLQSPKVELEVGHAESFVAVGQDGEAWRDVNGVPRNEIPIDTRRQKLVRCVQS